MKATIIIAILMISALNAVDQQIPLLGREQDDHIQLQSIIFGLMEPSQDLNIIISYKESPDNYTINKSKSNDEDSDTCQSHEEEQEDVRHQVHSDDQDIFTIEGDNYGGEDSLEGETQEIRQEEEEEIDPSNFQNLRRYQFDKQIKKEEKLLSKAQHKWSKNIGKIVKRIEKLASSDSEMKQLLKSPKQKKEWEQFKKNTSGEFKNLVKREYRRQNQTIFDDDDLIN